jgi:sulfur relay (sulfurtransferase) DsrC/TusE family protein
MKKAQVLSWEGIRIVLHQEDNKEQKDNMFRLESIAEAQLESDHAHYTKEHQRVIREIIQFLADYENLPPAKFLNKYPEYDNGKSTYVECVEFYLEARYLKEEVLEG